MKYLMLLLSYLAPIVTMGQSYAYKPKYSTILPLIQGPNAINPPSRTNPKNVESFWMPSKTDIDSLENNFKKVLYVTAEYCDWMDCRIKNLENYAVQYLGIVIKGEKYIYVNAFHFSSEEYLKSRRAEWKDKPVQVRDGGIGYWGILYNLEKSTFEQLAFNGDV